MTPYAHWHYACAQEQAAPFCCTSSSPFEVSPETAVHKLYNYTTVVVIRIPDFAVYIIDSGQDWTVGVVLFDIMSI